ncbi:hypothetical protein LWI28_016646 [Acer negundo]|uniref:Uncharacterized protein n=1 Tax=Acer negundo TaxID=4023 RepID=A0AAD5NSC1_ACENE|nr:hypothetical protein LWI28_016646 [Acer negundo]
MLEDVSGRKSKVMEDHDHDDEDGSDDAMEEGATSIHQSKTTTRFIRPINSDEPTSKKWLFHRGDVETLKSKFKTSIPYTIHELYTSIAQLVTQLIKESEERKKSYTANR